MDNFEIFTQEGYAFLARWAHFLAGITWIGILYYFNFVQVPSVKEMGDAGRSDLTRNLVPRALWWFRWGALLTILSGITILAFNEQLDGDYFTTAPGISIATGAILGTVMFGNVWLVIWPAQKLVIASAETIAGGGEADPAAAPAGRRALLASRANTLFSIPLLFFMAATSHLVASSHFRFDIANDRMAAYWIVFVAAAGAIELAALGRFGGYGPGWIKAPFETRRDVIVSGFVLLVILYVVFELAFQA